MTYDVYDDHNQKSKLANPESFMNEQTMVPQCTENGECFESWIKHVEGNSRVQKNVLQEKEDCYSVTSIL